MLSENVTANGSNTNSFKLIAIEGDSLLIGARFDIFKNNIFQISDKLRLNGTLAKA